MQELAKVDEITEKPAAKPEVDMDAIMARMQKLEDTNSRLLEESKTNKSKYQGLKSDVEDKEKAQLTENEQWKELLEIEKNNRSNVELQLKDTKKSVLQKELNFKVASLAKDAHDVNDIISALPKDLISIDEDSLSINGVDEAVNQVRESKPWLFVTETKSGMASARPVMTDLQAKQEINDEDIFKQAIEAGIL